VTIKRGARADALQTRDQLAVPVRAAHGSAVIAFAAATRATVVRNEWRFPILPP